MSLLTARPLRLVKVMVPDWLAKARVHDWPKARVHDRLMKAKVHDWVVKARLHDQRSGCVRIPACALQCVPPSNPRVNRFDFEDQP